MNPAVAAVAKKVAAKVLSNKKASKVVVGIVLVAIIIIFIPICLILVIFDNATTLDLSGLSSAVISQMDQDQLDDLQHINDTMTAIESAMTSAGFTGARITEAYVLFNVSLYDQSNDPGFVDKLVGCFQQGQTDAQLIAAVNQTFSINISSSEFSDLMSSVRAVYIDSSEFTAPTTKNNLDLVKWAQNAASQHWGYVWGTYGQILDDAVFAAKLEQYPTHVGNYEDFIRANWLGGRTADCIGLIKGYSWFDPETGKVNYATNGFPDINADYMASSGATKGPISTIPETPGLAVWRPGHIGIYIGNGQVIEAKATKIGVVQTQLSAGTWTHWIKIPYINYIEEPEPTEAATQPPTEP